MRAKFGRMIFCHMVADSPEELLEMVDLIGVKRKWIQNKNTWREHFDITVGKKKLAVKAGAMEVSMMELGRILSRRRNDLFSPYHRDACRQRWLADEASAIPIDTVTKRFD